MAAVRRIFWTLACAAVLCACSSPQDSDPPAPGPDGTAGSTSDPDAGAEDSAVDAAEDIDTTPAPLRLVTWNTKRFYDDVSGNCENCYMGETVERSSDYRSKLAIVAGALARLEGDVVMLQEVENKKVLNDLADHGQLASLGYSVRDLIVGNDPVGLNIGVLSRVPIDKLVTHKDDRFTVLEAPEKIYKYARDALEVHLRLRGEHVVIIGVHFKSRTNDEPDRRLAEAQHTRGIADKLLAANADTRVLIAGDYNDEPGSDAYLAVRNGLHGPAFINAAESLPVDQRYTYEYGNDRQMIDNIMASPNADDRRIRESVTILHDSSLRAASDHHPVAASYMVP